MSNVEPQYKKNSLKTLVIQKDYRNGNFSAKKGTQFKGEVIQKSGKSGLEYYFKVFLGNPPKDIEIGGVYGDMFIPMEYFNEIQPFKFSNPFKKDGSDFGITKLYFSVGVVGVFVIYKLIKGK